MQVEPAGPKRSTQSGCAQTLTSLFAAQTAKKRSALCQTTVSDVRLQHDRAYAFVRQPGMPVQFFPMEQEEGHWRVAALGGTVLEDTPGQ